MNCNLKKCFAALFLITFALPAKAQSDSITLDSCYVWAKKNYPMVKQYELIAKSNEFTLENISKGYLPQININGQATYQSDVTQLPKGIPGVSVLSKDQYKIYAEANQMIYDGGVIKEQKKLQEANSMVNVQKLEVELYKLKDRVNQLYFGILLIQEQLKQNALTKNDIQLGLDKINAQIANGTALQSNADVLKAELLKAEQQSIELNSNRKAFADMLGLFINKSLNEKLIFIKPQNIYSSGEINRPELKLYDYQNKIFDTQNKLLAAKNNPKISLFLQGGYGRPAFNILSNNFDPFYIGGLRFTFPLSNFYTIKNDRELINISKQNIDVQKNTFLFNTQLAITRQSTDITKLQAFLKTDDEIILLRTNVKKAALAQLENGVINSSDYLREVNAEDAARQNKILHEIQLLMAQYNERNTTGE
ncbi:MAG TPA: TolC family protein [Hanamia sp.]|jgi:outer membrane protein TolC|nr:TolC family protein [Hanamia sp.]